MTSIYRINGTDSIGFFSIDCHSLEEFTECYNRLRKDPEVEDVWTEEYDDEEGWQA